MANTTWKQVVFDVADGIRTLLGTSDTIPIGELKGKLTGIKRKSAATYTPSTKSQTIAAGQYLAGAQTIDPMPTGAFNLNVSSDGKIQAKVTKSGYLEYGLSKTKQLTTLGPKTITPNSSDQVAVPKGTYTTGEIVVKKADMEFIDVINGVIENYYAYDEDVNSATFVEFVNNETPSIIKSQELISSGSNGTGDRSRAIALDSTRVLILHSNGYGECLYAVVITISNDSYTIGTNIQLSGYGHNIDGVLMDDGRVFVIHDSTTELSASILSINGTTITVNIQNQRLNYTDYSGYYARLVKLNNGSFLILHSLGNSSTNYLIAGTVVTINGTSITTGTPVSFAIDGGSTADGITGIVLSNNKVLVIYIYNSNFRVQFLTINGTTITASKYKQFGYYDVNRLGNRNFAIKLSDTEILVTYFSNDSYYNLYGFIFTLDADNNVITKGNNYRLVNNATENISGIVLPTVISKINNNEILVIYAKGYSEDYTVHAIPISVNNGVISTGKSNKIISESISNQYFDNIVVNNNFFVPYRIGVTGNYSSSLGGILLKLTGNKGIVPVVDVKNLIGITKTKATTTSTGRVYIPVGQKPEISYIEFTINGTSYTAESGMTWSEWVDSDYNTGSFAIFGSYVSNSSGIVQTDYSLMDVAATDAIISGQAYVQGF